MTSIEFIESIQEKFFKWLYTLGPSKFPRVCEDAADVLGCWLHALDPIEEIDIIEGLYDGWSHCWVEVNGTVVDFTLSQFNGGMDVDEDRLLSEAAFYEAYFTPYAASPILTKEATALYAHEDYLFCCHIDRAKSFVEKKDRYGGVEAAFDAYLADILDSRRRNGE